MSAPITEELLNAQAELLELLPDIVYRLNRDGYLVYANAAIERLGYARSALIGRHIGTLIHPDDAATAILAEALKRNPNPPTPPAVLDERRTGERMTRGLRIRMLGPEANPEKIAMLGETTAVGVWEEDPSEGRIFAGTLGVIRDIGDRAAREALQREREALERYFSPDVARKIGAEGDADQMKGETVRASVLFMDIRNFTTISESLSPDQVAELLNRLFNDLMDLILSRRGSINKFMGDAILATFGCPFPDENDAQHAVESAMAIRRTLVQFNRFKPAYLKDDLRVGIGIATGEVFAGNIGSFRRKEYTVIGDTVNTASRLQNLTKKAGVDILIDETTRQRIASSIRTRPLQIQNLRGKTLPVRIHAVIEAANESPPAATVTLFKKAN